MKNELDIKNIPEEINYAPEQQLVLEHPKGEILVSASAGSGKTFILTERILSRLLSRESSIDKLVVVTFTEAAAKQMREKIGEKIISHLDKVEPDKAEYLREQLIYLPQANISTIHAFCAKIIKNFSYILVDGRGKPLFDSNFAMLDGTESLILLNRAVDEMFSRIFVGIDKGNFPKEILEYADLSAEEAQTAFYMLLDSYDVVGADENLRQYLINMLQKIRSLPHYDRFLIKLMNDAQVMVADYLNSAVMTEILLKLFNLLERALPQVEKLQAILNDYYTESPEMAKMNGLLFYSTKGKSGKTLLESLAKDSEIHHQLQRQFNDLLLIRSKLEHWVQLYSRVADEGDRETEKETERDAERAARLAVTEAILAKQINWRKVALTLKGSEAKRDFILAYRKYVVEPIYFMGGKNLKVTNTDEENFLYIPFQPWAEDLQTTAVLLEKMQPILRIFGACLLYLDEIYKNLKLKQEVLDFSDLEHYALKILENPEINAICKGYFNEIYIDEYQDTSSIQNTIMNTIGNNNIFRVGDIKQSIYRFRHAEPALFRSLTKKFTLINAGSFNSEDENDHGKGSLLTLNQNYRSVPNILEVANKVFAELMDENFTEITYDDNHRFMPFKQVTPDCRVDLLWLRDGRDGEEIGKDREFFRTEPLFRNIKKEDIECIELIKQLKKIHAQGRKWSEIAVLVRKNRMAIKVSEWLKRAAIPCAYDVEVEWFKSKEILYIEALLQIIDNPNQDLPLIAVMRSPLYPDRFSDNDLAELRLFYQENRELWGKDTTYYHEILQGYLQKTDWQADIAALQKRVENFWQWLNFWRQKNLTLTVPQLLSEILANDDLWQSINSEREAWVKHSILDAFLDAIYSFNKGANKNIRDFLNYIEELRLVSKNGESNNSVNTGVNVMTYHKSKGLEFNVVFLLELSSKWRYNSKDFIDIDQEYGFVYDFQDLAAEIPTYSLSPLKWLNMVKNRQADLSEQVRLLYVAMTRAKEQLFMLISLNPLKKDEGVGQFPPEALAGEARSWENVWRAESHTDLLHFALAGLPGFNFDFAALADKQELVSSYIPAKFKETAAPADDYRFNLQACNYLAIRDMLVAENLFTDHKADLSMDSTELSAKAEVGGEDEGEFTLDEVVYEDGKKLAESPGKTDFGSYAISYQESWIASYDKHVDKSSEPFVLTAKLADLSLPLPVENEQMQPVKTSVSAIKTKVIEEHLQAGRDLQAQNLLTDAFKKSDLPMNAWILDLTMNMPDWDFVADDRPDSEVENTYKNAKLGSLLHKFMHHLNFPAFFAMNIRGEDGSGEDVLILKELGRQLQNLHEGGILSEQEYDALSKWRYKLAKFFRSGIFRDLQTVYQAGGIIQRETPFSMRMKKNNYNLSEDVIIQGQIDLWYIKGDEIIVVDYKSDFVGGSNREQDDIINKNYARQLTLYGQALAEATGLKVAGHSVWLLRYGREVEIIVDI